MNMEQFRLWNAEHVGKQDNAGGGIVRVKMAPQKGTLIKLTHLGIGPDNYGAGRTLVVRIDSNDGATTRFYLIKTLSIDNVIVSLPFNDSQAIAGDNNLDWVNGLWVPERDILTVEISTPAQNEELTVSYRALIQGKKPAISVAGSGTVSLTETYDEVV